MKGYSGTLTTQVTEVRLGQHIGYVRENRRASSEANFVLSSNARLGHKADLNRIGNEVLELAAPKEVWDEMAAAIAEIDHMKRPVITHNRWTLKTAPDAFDKNSGRYG